MKNVGQRRAKTTVFHDRDQVLDSSNQLSSDFVSLIPRGETEETRLKEEDIELFDREKPNFVLSFCKKASLSPLRFGLI